MIAQARLARHLLNLFKVVLKDTANIFNFFRKVRTAFHTSIWAHDVMQRVKLVYKQHRENGTRNFVTDVKIMKFERLKLTSRKTAPVTVSLLA